jgi:hypothetical protein
MLVGYCNRLTPASQLRRRFTKVHKKYRIFGSKESLIITS